jgi:hypothetical protein
MTRKSISMLAMLVTGLLLVSILPLGVKAAPVITQMKHFPRFPVLTDRVNMSAKITSAVPIQFATLQYCFYYPPPAGGICHPHDLLGPDPNNIYNWTVDLDPLSISMDYVFSVLDTNGDSTATDPIFVQYAFNITATMTADITQTSPKHYQADSGQKANFTVTAYYSGNMSAPTEWSDVSIRRGTLEQWDTMTNVSGKCKTQIQVPAAVGTYTYNLTVNNRSLFAWDEISIVVMSEDLPEIVVETEDVVLSNTHPDEGDNITANISVENWGTLSATFHVLVTLYAGGSTRVLMNVSVTLSPANQTYLQVSWDAVLGLQYLNVTADPGNFVREVSETNNAASVFLTGEKPAKEEMPLLIYVSIILIVVMALIVIALRMRRKKPSTPQP